MEELDRFSDITGLKELTSFVDRYCLEFMTPDCKFDPIVQIIIDMPYEDLATIGSDDAYSYSFKLHSYCIFNEYEDLATIGSDDAYSYSFKLHSYCIFLRKELDKCIAKKLWCEEILHNIVARHWNAHSEYMKYEVKRHAIIQEDTFAVKVEKMRIYLSGAIAQSDNKLESVKKMADILQDFGKKKSYDK